jgi:excisionase family DNA binding protein
MEPKFLTLAEAAKLTPFSVKTLRRMIKAGRLPYSQPMGKVGAILVTEENLEAWLRSGGSSERKAATPVYSPRVRPYVPKGIGLPKENKRRKT